MEAPLGDFFANGFGKRQRGHQPAGGCGGRRFLQLFLADAVPEIGADGDREREHQADQPALLQHRLDRERQAARRTRPISTPNTGRNTRRSTGKDYVVLDTKGKGHYVGTVLACAPAAPRGSAKGTRKSTSTARPRAFDLGHGHGGLFPVGLGVEKDQHAVFRRAVFRPMGDRGRAHQRLSLAHGGPVRVQHGDQGDASNTSAGFRRTRTRRTRARVGTSARTITPAWRSGIKPGSHLRGARAARPRPHAAEPGARDSLAPRTSQKTEHHGDGDVPLNSWTCTRAATPIQAALGRRTHGSKSRSK